MGWLHPTTLGERVMPIAVAMPPAIHAYVNRARQLTGDAIAVQGQLDRSTEGADLAAAFHHFEALDLELRGEGGTVVPTEDIGVIDTHRLTALAPEWIERDELDQWGDVDDMLLESSEDDVRLAERIDHDAALIEEAFGSSDGFREWAIGGVDESAFPRYQIQVGLIDDAAIP